jgi:CRISPR-associated protein Csd1
MLTHLVQYARSHNLVAEPGFAPKTVRWSFVLEPGSGAVEVVDLAAEGGPGRTFARSPELSQPELKRGGSGCRHFLVDNADVVALLADDPDDPKLRAKHEYFTGLLRRASAIMPRLADMAAVLDDGTALEQVRDTLRRRKAKPTDKVTFAIQGETPFYPVDSDLWHDWWRDFRRTLGAESSSRPAKRSNGDGRLVRCLASGELVEPAATHPKIAGLSDVGGLSMGDALASFKQESFCSYGLSQSANAPVSEEMAAAYRAALNHLIAEHSRRLAKIKVVHWFKDPIADGDDPVAWLFAGGEGPGRATPANRYYTLTLSGAAGRVMVRDWMEGPSDELSARIGAWFDDLSIVRRDGTGLAHPPKFLAVLGSLVRDLRDLPAPWESMMWRAAVHGERIPAQAHTAALGRLKIEILQNEPFNHARMGLLKAFHVRQGDSAMQPNLNEKHPAAAYQCGRLMAVLAALQYRALSDFGVGAIQRTYAAASSTPALVLGRLTRNAQTHLNKLDPGLARWFENRLAGIWNEIQDGIPSTLSLEEQSLFALGYYQQLAADRQRAQSVRESEAREPAS